MSRKKYKSLISFLTALTSSTYSHGFTLQSKPQNTDKTDFNTISGEKILSPGEMRLFGEMNYQTYPLVQKDSQLGSVGLIDGLLGVETSVIYGLTKKIQIGVMIPGQLPTGVMSGLDEIKGSLGDILIEPKVHLHKNVAIIPFYYAPTGDSAAGAGSNSGAYGVKLSGGKQITNKVNLGLQVGALFAPGTEYRALDQTMRYTFGAGVGYKVSDKIKIMAEIYGEQTKSNTGLEGLTFVDYKKGVFGLRAGIGSGSLGGGQSNQFRAFAGLSMDLGKIKRSKKKKEKETSEEYTIDKVIVKEKDIISEEVPKSEIRSEKDSIEKTEGPLYNYDLIPKEDINPRVNLLPEKDVKIKNKIEEKKKENKNDFKLDLDFFKESILLDDMHKSYPYVNNKEELKNINVFMAVLKSRVSSENFENEVKYSKIKVSYLKQRGPASTKSIKTNEPIKKYTPAWYRRRALLTQKKLKSADLLMSKNLDKYYKYKASGNSERFKKQLIELNWGIKVAKKRIEYLKFLNEKHKEKSGNTFLEYGMVLEAREESFLQNEEIIKEILRNSEDFKSVIKEEKKKLTLNKNNIKESSEKKTLENNFMVSEEVKDIDKISKMSMKEFIKLKDEIKEKKKEIDDLNESSSFEIENRYEKTYNEMEKKHFENLKLSFEDVKDKEPLKEDLVELVDEVKEKDIKVKEDIKLEVLEEKEEMLDLDIDSELYEEDLSDSIDSLNEFMIKNDIQEETLIEEEELLVNDKALMPKVLPQKIFKEDINDLQEDFLNDLDEELNLKEEVLDEIDEETEESVMGDSDWKKMVHNFKEKEVKNVDLKEDEIKKIKEEIMGTSPKELMKLNTKVDNVDIEELKKEVEKMKFTPEKVTPVKLKEENKLEKEEIKREMNSLLEKEDNLKEIKEEVSKEMSKDKVSINKYFSEAEKIEDKKDIEIQKLKEKIKKIEENKEQQKTDFDFEDFGVTEEKIEEPVIKKETKKEKVENKKPVKVSSGFILNIPDVKKEYKEPRVPTKDDKFDGLEEGSGMEYIDGPSFDGLDE